MHTLAAWIMLATAACCPMMVTYRPPEPVRPYNETIRRNREREMVAS